MQGHCFDSAYVKDYIKWSSQNKITITKMSMFNNFMYLEIGIMTPLKFI
jgi:hypothetical protein